MSAEIIPFPKQPAAALLDQYGAPAVIQSCHEDGMPVRKGDRVFFYSAGNFHAGTVGGLGMISQLTGERTYSVIGDDGIVRVLYARKVWAMSEEDRRQVNS